MLWSTIKSALGQIFAPLTRKINNKPLSSDVVLTGDDIATSATDGTTVSSSLSNRLLIHANNAAGIDCNLLIEDGRYQIQSPNILNAPPWIDPTYGHFFIDVFHHMDIWVRQTAYEVNSTRMYTRACLSGSWSQWEPIATATPPQEFDLPLAEGLEPIEPCRYSKDQFGRVLVNIDCNPTTGSVSIGENQSLSIGTLPEGFRPAHYTSNACEVIVGQSRYIGTFDINEYGAITLWTAAPSASIIIGSVLFDTA